MGVVVGWWWWYYCRRGGQQSSTMAGSPAHALPLHCTVHGGGPFMGVGFIGWRHGAELKAVWMARGVEESVVWGPPAPGEIDTYGFSLRFGDEARAVNVAASRAAWRCGCLNDSHAV